MLPDRVSNPGPLTYESGALPIALRGPGLEVIKHFSCLNKLGMNFLILRSIKYWSDPVFILFC